MNAPSPWERAQVLEREFHSAPMTSNRRLAETSKRRFIAGVLGLVLPQTGLALPQDAPSVLDIGCGPDSLTRLLRPFLGDVTALDPLFFSEEDEGRYIDAGIDRVISAAEDFAPWEDTAWRPWDEVWVYNCLQHTRDPLAVLTTAQRCARRCVRVFEYVDVPTDALHLHVITADLIKTAFRGWNPAREVRGVWKQHGVEAPFYSALFLHRSEDALSW